MRPSCSTTVVSAACGCALAVTLAGCGITDPYKTPSHTATATRRSASPSPTSTSTRATADTLDPPSERHGTIPASRAAAQDRSAAAGSRSAWQAVIRYATLYINWTAKRLAARQRELARLAIGPARQQAAQEAASAPTDRVLIANHVANHGQVISAQVGRGPAGGRWVIVTREQTTGTGTYHGLPAQLHVTYAIAIHTHHGWVITQWSPQT